MICKRPSTELGAPFRRPLLVSVLAILLALPGAGAAHELYHRVTEAGAMVVQFYFPDDDHPYFEPYEVFPPGSDIPFQTGRVNALGEVSFRPDRPGEWRVRVATEDGHGALARVDVDDTGDARWEGAGGSRNERITASLGYLFGIFGLVALWRLRAASQRKRR